MLIRKDRFQILQQNVSERLRATVRICAYFYIRRSSDVFFFFLISRIVYDDYFDENISEKVTMENVAVIILHHGITRKKKSRLPHLLAISNQISAFLSRK